MTARPDSPGGVAMAAMVSVSAAERRTSTGCRLSPGSARSGQELPRRGPGELKCPSAERNSSGLADAVQVPLVAVNAAEPGVVADGAVEEAFLFGVPLESAAVPVGEIDEVADGDGAGADLDVADRAFAGADAGEPVADVIVAIVELDLVLFEVGLDQRFGVDLNLPRFTKMRPSVPMKVTPLPETCFTTVPLA